MKDFIHTLTRALEQSQLASNNSLQPPKFSGHNREDIDMWLDKFLRYTNHAQLDENRQLLTLKAMLDRPAVVWLQSLDDDDVKANPIRNM